MSAIRLSLRGVTKRFGSARVVDGVTLDIRAGETFTLLGPSGCGKTTTATVLYQGDRSECEIRVGDELIFTFVPPGLALAQGQDVSVRLPREAISVWLA